MVTQIHTVLDAYAANGGYYREVVLPDCGHSPHIEQPQAFNATLLAFLDEVEANRKDAEAQRN
jgi:pimeloyl-ACP methyl ester carboxylesterase